MDILIISDTHGRAERLAEVLRRTGADVLLFLGDGLRDLGVVDEGVTVRAVRGNCDWSAMADAPELRLEIFGGVRILMMHGHRYNVKGGIEGALAVAAENEADVLLYGHTHVPLEKTLSVAAREPNPQALRQ